MAKSPFLGWSVYFLFFLSVNFFKADEFELPYGTRSSLSYISNPCIEWEKKDLVTKGNPFSINALLARLILIGGYCHTWTVPGAEWAYGTRKKLLGQGWNVGMVFGQR